MCVTQTFVQERKFFGNSNILLSKPTKNATPPTIFRYRQHPPHSRIPQVVEVARAIKGHWARVANWAENRSANGILEGFNSLFQAVKARGYRKTETIKANIS